MPNEKYRNEWKYLIDTAQRDAIRSRLEPLLAIDPNAAGGSYTVRSLYFDDYFGSAYAEKDSGVMNRRKYRIRIYNGSDASIKLERKKKVASYISKEAASLTRDEFCRILRGDYAFLLASEQPLLREFYVECVSSLLRPRVVVDYERTPWTLDEGTVRVTFDSDVSAAVGSFDIFDASLARLPVLEPGKCIMEVKFTEFLPGYIRKLLPDRASEFVSASKFSLCCDKTAYLNGFDYPSNF